MSRAAVDPTPMTRTRRTAAALVVLLAGASAARAQPGAAAEPAVLRGESAQTRKRLAEAEQKILGGKTADAVDDLQRILDEAGDDLVSVAGKQYRPARWVAHEILAKLPTDALAAYRDRIDQPARKLLDAGRRDRDPRPLWQLLDRYFVSRPAEEGLLLLGDLLFERGEYRTAELVWKRLLPGGDISYPGPKTDPDAVRARVVLAAIFQGEIDRAKAELDALKAKHPGAAGPFAGKTGPYADTLQAFLDHPPHPAPEAGGGRSWPTFAGDPGRTGRVHGPIPIHWPTRPTWTAKIEDDKDANRVGPLSAPGRQPFGHPIIAGGHVYVSDGQRVFAFDLDAGKEHTIYSEARFTLPGLARPGRKDAEPDACSALTAANDRLYARLGPPTVRSPDAAKLGGESAIVCFAPPDNPGRNTPPMRELWRVAPPDAEGKGPGVWEGAPLIAGRRMWAALARFEGGRVVHSVVAFDPADPDKAPDRPAWVVEVSESPLAPGAESRTRQELLTLAGRNVVFCSNGGAVVALDAATGRRAWGFQYPRTTRQATEANRSPDPAPPVAAGGRVFVAPADAGRVYALDAETGQLLWESGPTEGAQILGVTRNRVVLTTTGLVKGIRALGVVNGSYLEPDGWIQHDGGGLLGYGRGLVTDDVVVWPSRGGLWFLNPDTGRPLTTPLRNMLPKPQEWLFGNLAYADGRLVVVTPTQVWSYQSDAPPFTRPPENPAPRPRFEAAIDEAERELAAGNRAAARELLVKTARDEFPASWRAWAAARLLLLDPPTDDPAKLPPDVRDVLTDDLRREWLLTAAGELVSFGTLADRHTGRAAPPVGSPVPPSLPADRKPPDAPALGPDARIASTLRLPVGTTPLRPITGGPNPPRRLFVTTGRELIAVGLDSGEKTTHTAAGLFTHAADFNEGFVAAGPLAVAVYGPGREPVWVFRPPDTDPLPGSGPYRVTRTGEPPPVPELSSFILAGDWLFARLGEHHLLALDLKGRRVAWVLGAHGRPRFEPVVFSSAPRFGPHFLATGGLVVAQLSDGRRWMIRAETGRVWGKDGGTFEAAVPPEFGAKTAAVSWPQPPVEVDANRLAVADGPGLVRFVNLATGRAKCAYEAEGESSLAGDPPQVRAWGDAVLVAVRRNYGVELDRVEPADGKSAWGRGPAFLDAFRVDLSAADADSQRVYVPVGNKLAAFGLDDGKPAWEANLPAARGWAVRAGRQALIAYPIGAVADEPPDAMPDRIGRSFLRDPRPWRLPWLAATAYDCWTDRTVPVLLLDPETGKQLRRLSVPARGPGVAAWFADELAVVATGDRVVWLR